MSVHSYHSCPSIHFVIHEPQKARDGPHLQNFFLHRPAGSQRGQGIFHFEFSLLTFPHLPPLPTRHNLYVSYCMNRGFDCRDSTCIIEFFELHKNSWLENLTVCLPLCYKNDKPFSVTENGQRLITIPKFIKLLQFKLYIFINQHSNNIYCNFTAVNFSN